MICPCLIIWQRFIPKPFKYLSWSVLQKIEDFQPLTILAKISIFKDASASQTVWKNAAICANILHVWINTMLQLDHIFCHYSGMIFPFETFSVVSFISFWVSRRWIYNFCQDEYFTNWLKFLFYKRNLFIRNSSQIGPLTQKTNLVNLTFLRNSKTNLCTL